MSKFNCICASFFALSMTCLHADDPSAALPLMSEILPEISSPLPTLQQQATLSPEIIPSPHVKPQKVAVQKPETPFSPFTGKIRGKKVRMRLRPDLDSRIIKELNRNELISVVGEKGDFWAVEPPAHFKAYVFRSFILDGFIEANHVNVRLEPSLDAPVIGHLNAGDRVEATVSAINNKWCEISPPASCLFYVAKELVTFAGGPELKKQMDKKLETGEELLDTTTLFAKSELRKGFDEIDFNRIVHNYTTVINDFDEFPELIEQAKEALASFQEEYLQKRIVFLEKQSKDSLAAAHLKEETSYKKQQEGLKSITDRMKMWQPVEEALYLTWANHSDKKNMSEFYEEQKLTAETLTGIVDQYISPAKGKPGDFILRDGDQPIAYLYSTQVNLSNLIGKQARFIVSARPNNNFAFPAYYVLAVE